MTVPVGTRHRKRITSPICSTLGVFHRGPRLKKDGSGGRWLGKRCHPWWLSRCAWRCQIRRSARSQEGTSSDLAPSGSTRGSVGVLQMPSWCHSINSCRLGRSSTSRCQRPIEATSALLLARHSLRSEDHSAFLQDRTFQSSSTWRYRVAPLERTEISAPRATEKSGAALSRLHRVWACCCPRTAWHPCLLASDSHAGHEGTPTSRSLERSAEAG